jgi:hypothetical protein
VPDNQRFGDRRKRRRGGDIRLVLSVEGTNLDEDRPKVGHAIALDGVFNVAKEFWPDVNHLIFHGKY